MTAIGWGIAAILALAPVRPEGPRAFAGPTAIVAAEPASGGAGYEPTPTSELPPRPRLEPATRGTLVRGPVTGDSEVRERLRVAGTVSMVLAVVSYGLLAVGLGVGNATTADIQSLRRPEDIERRRKLLARGQVANGLGIGAAISAGVLTAVAIGLLAAGRPRIDRRSRAVRRR